MWAFRKRPQNLSDEERAQLQTLFDRIPELSLPYHFRWAVTDIFDAPLSRAEAASQLEDLRRLMDVEDEDGVVLLEFFKTYDAHRDAILAYFDDRKTSGPVEGLNNKARVITKRCYGVKNTKTLWNRLCLDVNLATQAARSTVQDIRALVNRIRDVFLGYYT